MQKIKSDTKYRIPWLDFLRFMAAFLVVVAHSRANMFSIFCNLDSNCQNFYTKIFYFITSFSDDAVLVFFLLSGFLVAGKTIDNIICGRHESAMRFVIGRFTRIMIPLAAALCVSLLYFQLANEHIEVWRFVGNLLSLQKLVCEPMGGILWTMPFIVWSYMLLLSLHMLKNGKLYISFIGVILISVTLCIIVGYANIGMGHYFLCFWLGAVAYYLAKRQLSVKLVIACTILALLCSVATKFAKPTISRPETILSTLNVPTLIIAETIFLSIVLAKIVRIQPTGGIAKFFEIKISRIASFSYSVYLTHLYIIKLAVMYVFPRQNSITIVHIFNWLIVILGCFLFGYIFYLLIEKPTDSIRKFLLQKLDLCK